MTSPTVAVGPPLGWPDYEITFADAVKRGYRKYVAFDGRASRAEFWYFYLFTTGTLLILVMPSVAIGVAIDRPGTGLGPIPTIGLLLAGLFYLGSVLPLLAAAVRRLHDAGYSGVFLLLGFVAGIIPLILCMLPTSPSAARFGPPGQPGYPLPGQPYAGGAYVPGAPPGYAQAPYGTPPVPPAQGYGAQPSYPPSYPPSGAPGHPPSGPPGYPQSGAPGYPQPHPPRGD